MKDNVEIIGLNALYKRMLKCASQVCGEAAKAVGDYVDNSVSARQSSNDDVKVTKNLSEIGGVVTTVFTGETSSIEASAKALKDNLMNKGAIVNFIRTN